MDDAGPGAIRAISAWRNMACEAAEGSLSEAHDNWVTEVLGADPRACAGVVADFGKGLASGVAKGVTSLAKGVAKGVEAVAGEGYALATDSKARAAASHSLKQGADAAGIFVAGLVKDPGTVLSDAAGAVEGAARAVAGAAEGEYAAYETAAASGRGAAFLGEAVGEGALLVGGALIPSGGEAEAGIAATEGASLATTKIDTAGEAALDAGRLAKGGAARGVRAAGAPSAQAATGAMTGKEAAAARAATVHQTTEGIDAEIAKNLRSPEKGLRLEGETGKLLKDAGFRLVSAGRKIGTKQLTGEIDLETDEPIIECFSAPKGKLAQINKLMHDAAMNPRAKPVVLYAPLYGRAAGNSIVQAGARLARTPQELVALLKSMRGK